MARYVYEKYSLKYYSRQKSSSNSSSYNSSTEYLTTSTGSHSISRDGYFTADSSELIDTDRIYLIPLRDRRSSNRKSKTAGYVYSVSRNNINYTLYETYGEKNEFIGSIIAEDGTYPDDGESGGFWYVKIKKAFPTIKLQGIGTISGAKFKDSSGNIREIVNVKYKDSSGQIKNLK